MSTLTKFEKLYHYVRQNRWLWYFTWFNRFALAAGFILAGIVKIRGERFASGLSANHPMGHYLEALFHTGYYYPFIGIIQILAAILLIIPRTATLGALLYFPIIINITVLSFAVRFEKGIEPYRYRTHPASVFQNPFHFTNFCNLVSWKTNPPSL